MTFEQLRVGAASTPLYAPVPSADNKGTLVFLLLDSPRELPPSLTLDQTWGVLAEFRGYYLFLNAMPSGQALLVFSGEIQKQLAPTKPASSAFAWVVTKNGSAKIQVLLETKPDKDAITIKQNARAEMPQPFQSVLLLETTPIVLQDDVFLLQYPNVPPMFKQPASGPSDGNGLNIPFTGPLRGCFTFLALDSLEGGKPGSFADKDLLSVSADPLAPRDPNRSFMAPTGLAFRLHEVDGLFTITSIEGSR